MLLRSQKLYILLLIVAAIVTVMKLSESRPAHGPATARSHCSKELTGPALLRCHESEKAKADALADQAARLARRKCDQDARVAKRHHRKADGDSKACTYGDLSGSDNLAFIWAAAACLFFALAQLVVRPSYRIFRRSFWIPAGIGVLLLWLSGNLKAPHFLRDHVTHATANTLFALAGALLILAIVVAGLFQMVGKKRPRRNGQFEPGNTEGAKRW